MNWEKQAAKDARVAGKRMTDGDGGLIISNQGTTTWINQTSARNLAQQEHFLSALTNVKYVLTVFTKRKHQHIIWTVWRRAKIVQTVIGHQGHPPRAPLVSKRAHQDSMQMLSTATPVPPVRWDFSRKRTIKHCATHVVRLMMRTKMKRVPPAANFARADGLVEPPNKVRLRAASHAQLAPSW